MASAKETDSLQKEIETLTLQVKEAEESLERERRQSQQELEKMNAAKTDTNELLTSTIANLKEQLQVALNSLAFFC